MQYNIISCMEPVLTTDSYWVLKYRRCKNKVWGGNIESLVILPGGYICVLATYYRLVKVHSCTCYLLQVVEGIYLYMLQYTVLITCWWRYIQLYLYFLLITGWWSNILVFSTYYRFVKVHTCFWLPV